MNSLVKGACAESSKRRRLSSMTVAQLSLRDSKLKTKRFVVGGESGSLGDSFERGTARSEELLLIAGRPLGRSLGDGGLRSARGNSLEDTTAGLLEELRGERSTEGNLAADWATAVYAWRWLARNRLSKRSSCLANSEADALSEATLAACMAAT